MQSLPSSCTHGVLHVFCTTQVLLQAREAITTYYNGELEADDELARAANNGESTFDAFYFYFIMF